MPDIRYMYMRKLLSSLLILFAIVACDKTNSIAKIVPMDHYGATYFDGDTKIKVYGDKLSWAVIESNFKTEWSER